MIKLKAGSLQLVTFIVVIIALLLSSFIILIHVYKQFRIKTDHAIESVGLADRGISHLLQNESRVYDTISIQLNTDDYKSVKVHKSYWGTFEKVISKAKIKSLEVEKIALVGAKRGKLNVTALMLVDNNKPMVLVGNTKIEGRALLPKRGVKPGNIAGVSYYNGNYIYGNSSTITSFPKIDMDFLSYLTAISTSSIFNNNSIEYINLNASKKHINSFRKPLKLIYNNSEIVLSEISIVGQIIIQSESKITVTETAKLTDIILIAPRIVVKNNVVGSFQAFASEHINIEKNVRLEYPSSLVLHNDNIEDEPKDANWIFIDDYSEIKGNVLALGKNTSTNYDSQIRVNPNAIIRGVVYCEQNLELRGTVFGTVYTDNFIIKEKGSIYQNHLYNARISSYELESEFVSFPLEKSTKGIAKWLY
ncbi:hypothetical protein [uncultured Winogradskyella sp.]|uniref:hypothetical protein n=1 Tax=uncultured Winogradskyella sp. TaxID=395353 RepID=UPI00260E6D82|nr:hypothetical protein [uncultured Winogradskyella sp.]